jgi:hypothetical protein
MKSHLLALVLFGFVPVIYSQQVPPANAGQQVATQEQQSDDPNQEAPTAPTTGAIPQQLPQAPMPNRGPYRRDWSHGHEVWPGTVQQPGTDESAICGDRSTNFRDRNVGLDGAAKSINPHDVNYGGLLALWRLQLVHDTILKAEYWGVVVEGIAITILLLYVFWMRNQRAERFRMTVDMVHQLLNSRAFARFHATRVINIHNELVRKLNDEYESKLRSGGSDESDIAPQQVAIPRLSEITEQVDASEANQIMPFSEDHLSEGSSTSSAIPVVAAGKFSVDSRVVNAAFGRRGSNSVEEVLAKANAAASAVDLTRTEPDEGENKDAKIRRLEAQVEAKDQKIRAMRNNINRNRQHEAGSGDDEMDGAN